MANTNPHTLAKGQFNFFHSLFVLDRFPVASVRCAISLLIGIFVFLLILPVPQSFAKEKKEIVLTPRAQQLMEQAPKTPEELLAAFKDFLEHPETDIVDFVEQITGVDRSYWIDVGNDWQRVPCLNPDYDLMITGAPPNEIATCSKCDIEICKSGSVYLYLRGIKPTLTPAKIIAAFGKPKKVRVTHPWGYSFSRPFQVFYGKQNNQYYVDFRFLAEEQLKRTDGSDKIFENVAYNPNDHWRKQKKDLMHYLRQYKNHKDFKPYLITISSK